MSSADSALTRLSSEKGKSFQRAARRDNKACTSSSVTQNLSDGLRSVVMSSVGRELSACVLPRY